MNKMDDDLSFLDNGDKHPAVMIAIGAGTILVIVVICLIIWNWSHNNNSEGILADGQTQTAESDNAGETLPAETEKTAKGQTEETAPADLDNAADSPVDGGTAGGMQQGDLSGYTDDDGEAASESAGSVTVSFQDVNDTKQNNTDSQTAQGSQVQTNGNTVVTSSGRTITFTSCDDMVSPKMEVNLRGEPSTDLGNASIHHRLPYGEQVHRTGYDEASGWSRVEYGGEILYAVTSYIYVVEEKAE